jgi:hypothetical protein
LVVGVGELSQPATPARPARISVKGSREAVSDKARLQPRDQRLLCAPAALLQGRRRDLQHLGDLCERDASESRLADHEGVVGADNSVLDGSDEDEVGMAERQRRKVRQFVGDVAGSKRELPSDEAVDAAEAGAEKLLERVALPGLELADAFEEAGERFGFDVGTPGRERPLARRGQLAQARQQHAGEGDGCRAAFRLRAVEQDANGGVADPQRHPLPQEEVP